MSKYWFDPYLDAVDKVGSFKQKKTQKQTLTNLNQKSFAVLLLKEKKYQPLGFLSLNYLWDKSSIDMNSVWPER